MSKYRISKRVDDKNPRYTPIKEPLYPGDDSFRFELSYRSYYILINKETKRQLPTTFFSRKDAKRHADKLERKVK